MNSGKLRYITICLFLLIFICTGSLSAITVCAADASESMAETGSTSADAPEVTAETDSTSADTARVVRVAFPEQEGMSFIGHSGMITGYNYDYLQKISEYTGWQMEYVAYPDADGNEAINNAINDLMEGKVDLLGPLLKNEQTEKLFDFPERSYGMVYTTLCALTTGDILEANFKMQDNIRVGLWEQAKTRNSEVIAYLDSENINYTITYYATADEQLQALHDKEVDVISSVSLSPIANTRIVAQFAPRSYYFAATKGNTELIQEVDAAIARINQIQPHLQDTLFTAYFRNTDDEFVLSDEQAQTLSEIKTLHVLCIDQDAPYVYQNHKEPSGMLISILNDFADTLNMSIDYTFCQSREDAQSYLDKGSYDLLIGMPFTSDYCSQNGFIQSEPVILSSLAYARSPYKTSQDSIAIVRGLEDFIDTSSYKDVQLYDNAADCIAAVSGGQADIAAGDRSVMEYYIYESDKPFTTSLISGETQQVCIAISRNCPDTLAAVLNNYLYSLSDAVKTSYLSDSNSHNTSLSLTTLLQLHPVAFIVMVILIILIFAVAVFILLYTHQINRKNEELRIANAAKSEFLTRMSHDIRTPMNGIIGMLNVADKCIDNPKEVRYYHDKIRTASDYLLSLINDVLDMSRMESNQIMLEDRSVYLHQIVKSCIEITENRAAEEGIILKAEGLDTFYPPRVFASEQHIRQILLNLISNAIKYNEPGGSVTVTPSVIRESNHDVTCRFIVQDTGIGMSEEFQKHMFEPFSQENGGARSNFGGTGLGLAIVKKIVEYKKGDIQVDSIEGKGTTFTVTLTFLTDQNYKSKSVSKISAINDITGLKILAAEDNDMNAELIRILLEDAGANITVVPDGQQLVNTFKQSEPGTYDCILTDIMMPVMDGYEAARVIRSLNREDAANIPIIALTANAYSEDAQMALDAGMNAHIAKPFDIEQLKKCLANVHKTGD